MKTLAEKIAVMQAAEKGAQIQETSIRIEGEWYNYDANKPPQFNWEDCDYRIKDAPKYRAWKTVDEVPMNAVIRDDSGTRSSITSAYLVNGELTLEYRMCQTAKYVLEHCTMDDKVTPCGVLEA